MNAFGATRTFIAGQNGLMCGLGNLSVHPIEAPGTSVSGVFVVGDLVGNLETQFLPRQDGAECG